MTQTIETQIKFKVTGNEQADRILKRFDAGLEAIGDEADRARQKLANMIPDKLTNASATASAMGGAIGSRLNQAAQQNLAAQQSRFDTISQTTGFLGDFDTALATVGGTIGGTTGEIMTAVAGFSAVAEAVPRMAMSLQALPSSIMATVGALGPMGMALIAVGAVIVGVISEINRANEEANKQFEATVQARRAVETLVSESTTLEDAQARVQELQRTIELENRLREESAADLEAEFARVRDEFARTHPLLAIFADGIARLRMMFGLGDPLEEEIANTEAATRNAERELELLNEAINDGKFAAAEAESTVKKQTTAQKNLTKALEESADATTKRISIEDQAAQAAVYNANVIYDAYANVGRSEAMKLQEDYAYRQALANALAQQPIITPNRSGSRLTPEQVNQLSNDYRRSTRDQGVMQNWQGSRLTPEQVMQLGTGGMSVPQSYGMTPLSQSPYMSNSITVNVPLEATAIQPEATTNAVRIANSVATALGGVR